MVTIPNLTEITQAASNDSLIIETSGGTRRITRANNFPRRTEVLLIEASNVNVTSDQIAFWDATDGLLKAMTVQEGIFGNYNALAIEDGFTLDPALHNGRPLELRTTFTTPTVTLDGNINNLGGSTFFLNNFTPTNISVALANGIVMFVEGVSQATATIRENTSATIQVNNAGDEAIFSGG